MSRPFLVILAGGKGTNLVILISLIPWWAKRLNVAWDGNKIIYLWLLNFVVVVDFYQRTYLLGEKI